MRFYREIFGLLAPFWLSCALAAVLGAVAGLATVWLLATINRALHAPDGLDAMLMAQFAVLAAIGAGGTVLSGFANNRIGQRIVASLRKSVSARILRAPIAELERHGHHRLLAVLTADIDTLSNFAIQFSGALIAAAVACGSLFYLLLLSPGLFALCGIGAALFIAVAARGQRAFMRSYEQVRNAEDELRKQYRALTEGAKELRLDRARRARLHGLEISGAADTIARLRTEALRQFWNVDAVCSVIFFAVIAILLVLRQRLGIGAEAASGAVLVLLFAKGPIEQIVMALPMLSQAQVAFRRIVAISSAFPDRAEDAGAPLGNFETIALGGACYRFGGANDAVPFTLGPVDLCVARGETLFIVGENGSGKTTLIKLLLGLYVPSMGKLLLDGHPVGADGIDDYRQLFSAVFSDYFLFDDLPDAGAAEPARILLDRFEIAHKVGVAGSAFTTTDLSTGERKRLALIRALLQDRPVMMFDEWPADQDPAFRRMFYCELLPELKRRGKTLIVISHDDRYFAAADRIVHLSAGKVHELRRPAATA